METALLGAGIACIIAAVFGGGLTALGINFPVLSSIPRQMILGFVGAVFLTLGLVSKQISDWDWSRDIGRTTGSEKQAPQSPETQPAPVRPSHVPVAPPPAQAEGFIYLGQREGDRWAVNRYAIMGALIDTENVPKPGETHRVLHDVNLRTRPPSDDKPLVMSSSLGAVKSGSLVKIGTVSKIGDDGYYWAAATVLPSSPE